MPSTNSSKPRRNQTARYSVSNDDAAAFFDQHYGKGRWAFDPEIDAWVVPDPDHDGPGLALRVFERDGSWFDTVVSVQ